MLCYAMRQKRFSHGFGRAEEEALGTHSRDTSLRIWLELRPPVLGGAATPVATTVGTPSRTPGLGGAATTVATTVVSPSALSSAMVLAILFGVRLLADGRIHTKTCCLFHFSQPSRITPTPHPQYEHAGRRQPDRFPGIIHGPK